MELYFKSRKVQKLFSSEDALRAKFGPVMGKKIKAVIQSLRPMRSLAELDGKRGKPHSLSQDKDGYISVHVSANYRLLFEPIIPEGVSKDTEYLSKVTSICIIGCVDYH